MAESNAPQALAVLGNRHEDAPQQKDLDKCVHCGLCLNACPTYRVLGVEMDSPRGRIYQMVQVATGAAEMNDSYQEHMDLCLACRACETACPSGVQYGKLIEAARTELKAKRPGSALQQMVESFVFRTLLPSRFLLSLVGWQLWFYQKSGLQALVRSTGVLKLVGGLDKIEELTPEAQPPFFHSKLGKVLFAEGKKRYRVAFLAGCMQNIFFARLNEATVEVLQKNGCEVVIPADQNCCGALHAHSGYREEARALARKNIDVMLMGGYDAIISNTGGCGATLKEYHELLEHDEAYHEKAKKFVALMKDVNEFLGSIELNPQMGEVKRVVTYQDSCHLAHGQKVRKEPRAVLKQIPGLTFREMPHSDLCCGSAGIYNVVQNDMAMQVLEAKMKNVESVKPDTIVSSNPGCMLQLKAGAKKYGSNQPVMHVVEVLQEAYRNFKG
jgi:glycolate oxidase iron-sulfur subunit